MPNSPIYNIAKCCTEKICPKCSYISDAIVVNRGTHYTLYCSKCGAYIKHASKIDKRYTYLARVKIEEFTPTKVAKLYIESSNTMTINLK